MPFKTHQHFCFIVVNTCGFLVFGFHPDRDFTVTESILRKKIFATSLYLGEIVLFRGTKRAILNEQYQPTMPAGILNQNSEFAASSPLA